jgi:hypothetical protein
VNGFPLSNSISFRLDLFSSCGPPVIQSAEIMQKTAAGETVIIPRNFKLLEELEKSEKGHGDMSISFGLVDSGDTFLSDCTSSIGKPTCIVCPHLS